MADRQNDGHEGSPRAEYLKLPVQKVSTHREYQNVLLVISVTIRPRE